MPNTSTYPRLDESLLSHVLPFKGLDRNEIRSILDQASSKHLNTGVTVFEEGADAACFFLLLDGYIRVVRFTPEGEKVIMLYIPSGQLFGIAAAFGRSTYPATAVTASESLVLSWPSHLFDEYKSRYQGFADAVNQTIGDRLSERNDLLVTLATQRVEQRVAKALMQIVRKNGRHVAEGIEIAFPVTRQDLSDMTATTLHTVSRLLSSWEKEHIIRSRRKRITVLSCQRLQTIADKA